MNEIDLEDAANIGRLINPVLMKHAIACSAPILMEKKAELGGEVSGGSCGFIRTPKRTFGITAYHVFKAAKDFIDAGEGRVLVGQLAVRNFGELLISYSAEMDIATFTVPQDALPYIRAKAGWECQFSDYWPPIVPQDKCNIFFCGWPAALRDHDKGFVLRPLTGAYLTHSVSEEKITIQRDKNFESESDIPNPAPFILMQEAHLEGQCFH